MKSRLATLVCTALFLIVGIPAAQGQVLKKLGKRAQRAAERTVERRVERESAKKTDQVLDSILEPGSGQGGAGTQRDPSSQDQTGGQGQNTTESTGTSGNAAGNDTSLEIYRKYDFTPGEELIWYDDFAPDAVGDFPANWNTNGSGEIVTLSDHPGKWLQLSNKTVYVPEFPEDLPENYTIEFDMVSTGLDRKTSTGAFLRIRLEDDKKLFESGTNAHVDLPLAQYTDAGIRVRNRFDGQTTVRNSIQQDIREAVKNRAHVSIAVNGPRLRLWMNERKVVDLPRFLKPGAVKGLKFELFGLPGQSTGQYLFLSDLRIAESGTDMRSKLMKEGRFSTTGIYFESGSSELRPQSSAVLQPLGKLLREESDLRLKIVGHTDADGDEGNNKQLSLSRAEAVRSALTTEYQIDPSRLEVDGKGEAEPVSDNNSASGKAKNRRVEFIKL